MRGRNKASLDNKEVAMSYCSTPAFYWSQFSFRDEKPPAPDADRTCPRHDLTDAATRRMIEQYKELYKLRDGKVVVPLIEEWHWLDSMGHVEAKQELLEGLIQAVQRSPQESEGKLIFILLTLEPIRRSICKRLLSGMPLGRSDPAPERHRRQEARWIDNIERNRFFDASRSATLELIYSYPMATKPGKMFGWFRETLAWKILHLYETEYLSENRALTRYERARMAQFLTGLDALEPPELRDSRGFHRWLQRLGDTRSAFAAVDEYREKPQVRKAFQEAIGRLSDRRRDTIMAYFYDGLSLEQIAEQDGVTVSTVGNTKSQAEERLRHDDLLYLALDGLGRFRSEARREEIAIRYPDGKTEDGRRIFFMAS
jgi:RNA polymerase sigma factor (sigma-70 family)